MKRVKRPGGGLFFLMLLAICFTFVFTSCNVTRSITTSSQYYQRGDTSVVIQTKTIESYDGTLKKR